MQLTARQVSNWLNCSLYCLLCIHLTSFLFPCLLFCFSLTSLNLIFQNKYEVNMVFRSGTVSENALQRKGKFMKPQQNSKKFLSVPFDFVVWNIHYCVVITVVYLLLCYKVLLCFKCRFIDFISQFERNFLLNVTGSWRLFLVHYLLLQVMSN